MPTAPLPCTGPLMAPTSAATATADSDCTSIRSRHRDGLLLGCCRAALDSHELLCTRTGGEVTCSYSARMAAVLQPRHSGPVESQRRDQLACPSVRRSVGLVAGCTDRRNARTRRAQRSVVRMWRAVAVAADATDCELLSAPLTIAALHRHSLCHHQTRAITASLSLSTRAPHCICVAPAPAHQHCFCLRHL